MFNAKLFDELEPLYPDTNTANGDDFYRISAANGTYAGVHIHLSNLTSGIPVTFEVIGDNTAFKLFNLIPVPVEVNTGAKIRSEYLKEDINEFVIRRAPFMIYEVLEPFYNIITPNYSTAAIAFRYIVEYVKKEQFKKWDIIISHNGNSKKLTFVVDEFPVNVRKCSKDTHVYVNWFNFDNMASMHGTTKWTPKYEHMMFKYFRTAVYSRQNLLTIPPSEVFDKDDYGKLVLNYKKMDTIIRIAKAAGITLFNGGAFTGRKDGLSDDDDFYNSLPHNTFTNSDDVANEFKRIAFDLFDNYTEATVSMTGDVIPGNTGEALLFDLSSQLYEYVKTHNLLDVFTQCCLDEPNVPLSPTYKIITDITKKAMPNVKIMEPVLITKEVSGMLDIWCPTVDQYELNKDFFDDRFSQGDEIYVYTCLTPAGNYCNRMLDFERIRPVYIGWAPIKYDNISGYLHWGGNHYCGSNPYKKQACMFSEQVMEYHPKRANFLPAGDGAIFFPGEDEPLVTTRSEAHRIGFEDLEVLEIIKKNDNNKALEIVDMLFRGYKDFEKDIKKYREVKKLMLCVANSYK